MITVQDKAKVELEDERQRAETDFLSYVAESYRHFLAGDDHRCEQVDKAKAEEFEARAEEIRTHNSSVQQVLVFSSVMPMDVPGDAGVGTQCS